MQKNMHGEHGIGWLSVIVSVMLFVIYENCSKFGAYVLSCNRSILLQLLKKNERYFCLYGKRIKYSTTLNYRCEKMHNWKYITHVKHRGSLPNSPRQMHHFPVPTNQVNADKFPDIFRTSRNASTFYFFRISRKVPDLASDENLGNAKPIGVKHLLFRHFEYKE